MRQKKHPVQSMAVTHIVTHTGVKMHNNVSLICFSFSQIDAFNLSLILNTNKYIALNWTSVLLIDTQIDHCHGGLTIPYHNDCFMVNMDLMTNIFFVNH